ncbi:DUF6686 family protein [Terrimonas pollutisoli]|uniref:DUF6686 family protein n=1 Tax=Terrimonas pollutisoli TaxID=3034147 RepID=UPI0023ECEC5E|nr:DUF6686 family protein [Terrimonas sp. H1YJ31]
MCSYQTLYHDDVIGYVVRCYECEHIQMGYGNLMLTINTSAFNSFRSLLKKIMCEQSSDQKETLRCIVVPTPCEGIKLLLSLRELKEFDHMLEEADTELQSSCLLKLFNN